MVNPLFSNYLFAMIGASIQKVYYNGTSQIIAGNPTTTGNLDGIGTVARFSNNLYADFDPISMIIYLGDNTNVKKYNISGKSFWNYVFSFENIISFHL